MSRKNLGLTLQLVLVEWLALLLALGVLSQVALSHVNPFGHCWWFVTCNLYPADPALFELILIALVGTPILLLVSIPLVLFWYRQSPPFRTRRVWVRALLVNGCFVGLLLALLAVTATVASNSGEPAVTSHS